MKKNLFEHFLSIIFVAIIFIVIIYFVSAEKPQKQVLKQIPKEFELNFIDFDKQFHVSLLKETLDIFYKKEIADSLLTVYIENHIRKSEFAASKTGELINSKKIFDLFIQFIKFFLIYIVVLIFTYYGVQTLAILRFVLYKQNKSPYLIRYILKIKEIRHIKNYRELFSNLYHSTILLVKAIIKAMLYFLLFSPAYVIAYSFKTKFDTDSVIFMIFLGIISNGLLITYSQKFYTFLLSESNKGFVETAMIKNLNNGYDFNSFPLSLILRVKKSFPNHVFNHIFINAQYQYFATIKEQAAYLVSGLIIIEMALNIQGHLGYNLMQNLLFKNYIVVLIAIFLIYLLVKSTEIFIDIFKYKVDKKFANE